MSCVDDIGDPRQLLHPTDSEGNLCGSDKFSDRPHLYFFDWTKCIQSVNLPLNALKGRPFVCPTTQVCVAQCPNTTTYHRLPSYRTHAVCTYDVDTTTTEPDYPSLVNEGKCASYIIASKPLFGRCVPDQLKGLIDDLVQVRERSSRYEEQRVVFRHPKERTSRTVMETR